MQNISLISIIMITSAYLIGSISSAILICHLMGYPDPRQEGSNNPGATNVLRIANKKAAAMVLVFDILKATIPVLVGHALGLSYPILALIGMAAVVGHVFPIYYHFEGGKGVATALGMYFGLHWQLGLICTAIWLLSVKLSKYSSFSSIVMVSCAPFVAAALFASPLLLAPLSIITLVIALRHKENIQRLKAGTESKTTLF